MKTTLTSDQVADYHRHGFLAVEGLLDAAEVEHWRSVVQVSVDHRLVTRGVGGGDDYYRKVFTQCMQLAPDYPDLRDLVHDARLSAMAGALVCGPNSATGISVTALRRWHDQALFKGPYGHPTSWHLDVPFWSFDHAEAITVWIALDDATYSNGCLWYLPGTHRQATYTDTPIGAHMGALFELYPQWSNITPVSTPVRAGGAVFHNGLTAHAAGANLTGGSRRAMTMAWMPDGAKFNGRQSVLSDTVFARLTRGDLLNDPQQNPILHRQS